MLGAILIMSIKARKAAARCQLLLQVRCAVYHGTFGSGLCHLVEIASRSAQPAAKIA
jgi:hypothetical protein